MNKTYDVVIIGAGTAGLSAFKEAAKKTKNILLIDKGPLGTTCARVGCMPSKVFIHSANAFYERKYFETLGIAGGEDLSVDISTVLTRVRRLRDGFTSGIIKYIESLGDQFMIGEAKFCDENTIQVNDKKITAKKIIIATGSSNVVPKSWASLSDLMLTTNNFFEQEILPEKMVVVGGGVIGLELGQAMARLGVDTHLFHAAESVGGITDPEVNRVAIEIFKNEFDLQVNTAVDLERSGDNRLRVVYGTQSTVVDKALLSVGRSPNLADLNLSSIGVSDTKDILSGFCYDTLKVEKKPVFLAGDVNKQRPLLHEAADEGRIAGYNALLSNEHVDCFKRRAKLSVIFTQPNIISVGEPYRNLSLNHCVIGEVRFDNQGRSKIMCHNHGVLRVYIDKHSAAFLGAEGILPEGEHIAHLLAWALQEKMTVFKMLQMPFYHPVVEEGMRTALRDASRQLEQSQSAMEMTACRSRAIDGLG